jgi:hypothetical protein
MKCSAWHGCLFLEWGGGGSWGRGGGVEGDRGRSGEGKRRKRVHSQSACNLTNCQLFESELSAQWSVAVWLHLVKLSVVGELVVYHVDVLIQNIQKIKKLIETTHINT